MHATRREFLALCGVGLSAGLAGWAWGSSATGDALDTLLPLGRALFPLTLHQHPVPDAPISASLLADSTVPLWGQHGAWYQTAQGWGLRQHLQPIAPLATPLPIAALPAWAQVNAPVAAIRQWAAPNAPLLGRVGHGGVVAVIDRLGDWLGVQVGEGQLGWTQATHWSDLAMIDVTDHVQTITIDQAKGELMAYDVRERMVIRAPLTLGQTLSRGLWPSQPQAVGGLNVSSAWGQQFGAAFGLQFGPYALMGVHWHNHFGDGSLQVGPSVQVAPSTARLLWGASQFIVI
jgi:hypothetical protein